VADPSDWMQTIFDKGPAGAVVVCWGGVVAGVVYFLQRLDDGKPVSKWTRRAIAALLLVSIILTAYVFLPQKNTTVVAANSVAPVAADSAAVAPVKTAESQPSAGLTQPLAGLSLSSCIGKGGIHDVVLWGPTGEKCDGVGGDPPQWGTYDKQTRLVNSVGTCLGRDNAAIRLYGPSGEPCGGNPDAGNYDNPVSIVGGGLSSCVGLGGFNGMRLWGPTGKLCGGVDGNPPPWGTYDQDTRYPQ
jgi:hypothetical protein